MAKQNMVKLRTEMALSIQKLTKEGSKMRCNIDKKNIAGIQAYCQNAFFLMIIIN